MSESDFEIVPANEPSRGVARKNFRVSSHAPVPAPGRVPPHSVEAEEQLLSAALMDGATVLARCDRAKLTPAAFYVPANRLIYAVLVKMLEDGKPIDLAVLAEEMKTLKAEPSSIFSMLDECGGYPYLTRISGRIPTTAGAAYFLDKVREMWVLREADRRGRELVEAVHEYTGPSVVAHIGPHVLRLQRLIDFADRATRGPESLIERMRRRLERTRAMVAGKVDMGRCLTTGDAYMDGIFLPFDVEEEDWLCIVGGPPSGGKSSWMRAVTLANVRAGKFCVVFILETGMRWLEQAAATRARVNLRKRHEWTPDMLVRYEAAHAELEGFVADGRLMVIDDIFAIEDMERTVREVNRTLRERQISAGVPEDKARGLDFVVMDYLQLMGTRADTNGRWTREQVVSHVSRRSKIMLKQLNIVGFIGAQVNRKGREDPSKVPSLVDLRESGAIEQDADRVIFVHTPPTNKAGLPQTGDNPIDEVELHQRKSRNGPRDVSVGVLFEKRFTAYHPREDRPSAAPGLPKPAGGYGRNGGAA
jgi:replicative DNA helicase